MKKKKVLITVIITILIVGLIIGGTFAYLTWQSNNSQRTAVNFTISSNLSSPTVSITNTTATDLEPIDVCNGTNCLKSKITITYSNPMPYAAKLSMDLNISEFTIMDASYQPTSTDLEYLKWRFTTTSSNADTSTTNASSFTPVSTFLSTSDTNFKGLAFASNATTASNLPVKIGTFSKKIAANTSSTTETYYIYVWLDSEYEYTNYGKINSDPMQGFSFKLTLNNGSYEQVIVPAPVSFSTDSWETIQKAVQDGNTSLYNVGDTKTITLASHTNDCSSYTVVSSSIVCTQSTTADQTVTLRIANKSTPSECSTSGFSQTACGFVIEFVDIIDKHNMNPSNTTYTYGFNVGGWPASAMHTYIASNTSTIFQALPSDLRDVIIPTYVVSGHGNKSGETNFTSTDYLYLLSTHEVYEDVDGNTSAGIDSYDTAYSKTRQLDYYSGLGVTTSNYSGAIKQYNSSNSGWSLRSAYSSDSVRFLYINLYGNYGYNYPINADGVSPAFRIG